MSENESRLLKEKRGELLEVIRILQQLQNSNPTDADRWELESQKLNALSQVDQTELKLKNLEIQNVSANQSLMQAEQAEVDLMNSKILLAKQEAKILTLLTTDPDNFSLVEQYEPLEMEVNQKELSQKQQQVNTLLLRLASASGEEATRLQALITGEQNECIAVLQLISLAIQTATLQSRIHDPNTPSSSIAGLKAQLAALQQQSVATQLAMRQQNVAQLDTRLNKG